ncbi:exodeoxyribonuclease V subunit beta [Marinospirillum insulare]|uniref:RecBCD enzyme subunit RecB n=1 Tax=Marinospirillum insulare TaxID=217169 RepID=A0ABQ6A0F2_9GAMM|nr:exodeoxyribonuclease V subunit beta [Marinospirillum insulare]GLR63590.1 RecBCD enzyme subunit RecB [Marinospirillum insulare]
MSKVIATTSQLNPLTFPLWGSRLIEASAGTGKTFTLALLYVRLVLGHGTKETQFNRPLTPRDILVVTFTDAAAEELRDRIRNRLVEAAAYFRDGVANANDPLEKLRQDYSPKEWNTCAWKLQMAAEGMDESRVSTIHSWCNRVLVEQAFDTRGLFNRQLVTDTEDLLAQVVRDYWRVHFYPLDEMAAGLISDELKSPAELLTAIRNLLKASSQGVTFKGEVLKVTDLTPHLAAQGAYQQAKDEAAQAFAVEAEKRQAFEAEVKAHWVNNWQTIEEHLLELRSSLNARSHKSGSEADYLKLLGEIYAWAANNAEQPSLLKNFAAGEFKFVKNKPFQQENSLEAFQLLKDLLEQAKPAAINIEQPELPLKAAVLAHALPWVKAEFNKRMKQRAEMGFDDLLVELDKALDPELAKDSAERLAAVLKERFPIAMIDEFQDTDPIQYRIFDRIYQLETNSAASGLFMIGDPKQAIYSFRGADIYTYLQARTATEGRHYTLKKNFRSTQGVVEACNALFKQAESYDRAAFRFKEENKNPIPFVAVEAQGRDEQLYLPSGEAAPLTFWYFSPEEDEDQSLAITRYRELAAASAASEIVDWLMAAKQGKAGFGKDKQITQPLKPADIAILVRTGTEAKAMREALQARQVPSVYLSDRESLFSSQEAQDMLHWLYACANPLDERLVKAALGTNSLDLPLEQLAGWQEDELAWEAQMELFQQLHWQWQRQGVLVMLQQLLQHYQLPARLMQAPDGERHLTNLLHLAEWLQEASVELDGEQALIRHLAEYLDAGDQQQLLRLESDAERVKVITIHKSKGLEYPLVLLPFIGSWRDIDGNTREVDYQLETGKYQELAGNKTFKAAWDAANDARISEDMRLLYVALTRASHALWLGVAALKSGNAKKPQVERSALGYLLNAGQPIADATAYEEALKQLAATSLHLVRQAAPAMHPHLLEPDDALELDKAVAAPNLKDLTNWWIASYSAIQFQSVNGQIIEGTQEVADNLMLPASPDKEAETPREDQRDEEIKTFQPPPIAEAQPQQDLGPMSDVNVMHHFPAGAVWGTLLHSVLEWAAIQEYKPTSGKKIKGFAAVIAENTASQEAFKRFCDKRNIENFYEPLWGWLVSFVQKKWQLDALGKDVEGKAISFSLSDLKPAQLAVELEFMLESHQVNTLTLDKLIRENTLEQVSRPVAKPNYLNGLLKGFIDLVAEHDGRYYVIDWKSNRLGFSDSDYTQAAMLKQILEHRYDMQYVLYLVALHRLLKARLPDYDYDQHVGGAIYVFLRGMNAKLSEGLFCDKPPKALIEKLDALLAGAHSEQQGVLV